MRGRTRRRTAGSLTRATRARTAATTQAPTPRATRGSPTCPLDDGILGVAQPGGGFLYDVDQAASGALALADFASRHQTDDPANAAIWARAAGSVFNHLYTRARHPSGLYYAYLVTSSDPGHDALASVVTPNDALLTETPGVRGGLAHAHERHRRDSTT